MEISMRSAKCCVVAIGVLLAAQLTNQQLIPRVLAFGHADNADKGSEQWLATGRDDAETRFSPLKEIDSNNVGQLGLAWYFDTDSEPGALEATPIVANGTLYATLTWDVVIAVDARTGKLLWRYDPQISRHNFVPGSQNDPNRVRTGPTILLPANRGPAFYDGKVYVGLLDGRLIALDAATGKLTWEVHTTNPDSEYSITGAPRVIKGKVIIGNGGADFSCRGYVSAYDAGTGKLLWRFYTVPGDPHKPFENEAMARAAKTWKGDLWYKLGGGGTVWDAFAYDPELDLLYIGVGNGGPWDQKWRSPGGGDNLYLSSIVALRPDTGKFVWYFQETPGDEWDYTACQDMILADLKINGKLRKIIMQAPKSGFYYVLDRETGKFISAAPYAYVTWATGIDPKTGRPIEAPDARYDAKGVFLSPSNSGAHSWQTMSFNPATGLAYFPATNSTLWFQEDPSHFIYRPGFMDRGLSLDPTKSKFDQKIVQPPPDRPSGSFLLGWDPTTQKEVWRVPDVNGSTMTTAGNLVFSSSIDGHFMAFSADKGERLWQAQLVPGFGSPVTYMLDGKQYVSVLAGRAGRGRLYTFALGANLTIPSAAENNSPPSPGGAPATINSARKTTQSGVYSDAQAARGEAQYSEKCSACHMADLKGNGTAIALAGDSFKKSWNAHSMDQLFGVISTTMPQGNAGSLSPDTISDIIAYMLKVNHLPSGPDKLESDPEILKQVTIDF
ncbi:MAG: PQQ-dependent dehydrogenase, methanol/ethanol family [Terracidiphilus sp.]